VNGAVDFTAECSLAGRDVFEEVARVVDWDATALDIGATRFAAQNGRRAG